MAQYVANTIAGFLTLWWSSPFRPTKQFDKKEAKSSLAFGSNILGLDFLTFASVNADNFLIASFLGSTVLGYYTVAYRVLTIATELFTGVINSLVLPVLSKLRDDRAAMQRAILKATRLTNATAMPIFIFIAVLAQDLLPVVFGDQWHSSIPILQALCLGGAINAAVYFGGNVLMANNEPRLALTTSAVATLLSIVAFGATVHWGATAVAIGFAISSAIAWPIRVLAIRKVTGLQLATYFSQWIRSSVAVVIAAILMTAIRSVTEFAHVINIVVIGSAGTLGYVLLLIVLDRPFVREVVSMTGAFRRKVSPQMPAS